MWNHGAVTDIGRTVLAKAAGGKTLVIDGAQSGTGTVAETELKTRTSLAGTTHVLGVINYEVKEQGVCFTVQITSPGDGYTAKQIGLFGHVDNEDSSLLAIYQDETGITIPDNEQMPDFLYLFYAQIQMNNSGSISITLDPSVLVSQEQLYEELNNRMPGIINDWLDEHVMQETGYVIDDSLTVPGAAADAKKTGDALNALQEETAEIPDIKDDVDNLKSAFDTVSGVTQMAFEDGYIDIPDVGSVVTPTRTVYANRKSAMTEISGGQTVSVNVIGAGTTYAGGRAWAFLDENYTVISRAASQLTVRDVMTAPVGSAYVVLNTRTDTITDYYGYVGLINQSVVIAEADANAKSAVQKLASICEKSAIDLSTLQVKQFWIDIANSIVEESTSVPARLIVVPVNEGESVSVNIPLASTKRVAFCNAVIDGSPAYNAQEIVGSLSGVYKNDNYKYFVIQLFVNTDTDKDYTDYFQGAEIGTITAVDFVARDEIDDIRENGAGGVFIEQNLKGLPILDTFGDISIDTTAYDSCSAFHALVKEELCDNSNGYLVQTLIGNDGHGNDLYKYVSNPAELRYGAERMFGTPSYPITGGNAIRNFIVIVTTNIHGVEHGGNWVIYNLLKKLQNPDTNMLRFFKSRVKLIWVPYICASGNYENADGININRDFPETADGTCVSAEGRAVKAVLDEYGPVADLHIDIHTFNTAGTYARNFASWTFTDSTKLGKRSVTVSKSVVSRYAEKYPDIDVLKRAVVSAVNTKTTCTYYTQAVYGVPSGTIEGALTMGGSPSGADSHTSATAYLYDIITQVICSMAS